MLVSVCVSMMCLNCSKGAAVSATKFSLRENLCFLMTTCKRRLRYYAKVVPYCIYSKGLKAMIKLYLKGHKATFRVLRLRRCELNWQACCISTNMFPPHYPSHCPQ